MNWSLLSWRRLPSLPLLLLAACAYPSRSPELPVEQKSRDPVRAEELNAHGAVLVASDPRAAEAIFREALSKDDYCGAAHNNMGVIFLLRGDLYEAANEFEWARKLMPSHPDPRVNLGLTYERAGRVDEALAAYAGAREVRREHVPAMVALARLELRSGKANDGTSDLLREIAARSNNQEWREWARLELLKRDD